MHIVPILLLVCVCVGQTTGTRPLDILGLYPRDGDGWTEPFVEHSAALALRHIRLNGSILRDYHLAIDWKNTRCDSGVALKEFVDALGNGSRTYLAVFGGGCAVATSQVAALSYRYGLAQIAYASTAPNLGNRKLYPRFVRGVPSDINAVPARASFVQLHNWRRVAIINEQDPIFVASSHEMESVLDRLHVEYRVEDFAPSGTIPLDQQVRTIAENLRTNGYRIIIANMYEDAAIKLFCKLYQQKETYLLPGISTWIFLGWFTDQWHNKPAVLAEVGCTAEEVASVSNGALGFLVVHSNKSFRGDNNNTQLTIANLTPAQIYQEYRSYVLEKINNNTLQFIEDSDPHDAYVYDSLWTLALSLQGLLDSGTNLTAIAEKQIFRDTQVFAENSEFSRGVYQGMLRQRFEGWTGPVEYIGHERYYDRVQLLEFVWGELLYRGEFENIPHSNYTEEAIGNIKLVLDGDSFMYWDPLTATDGITNRPTPASILSLGAVATVGIAIYITFLIAMIMAGKFQGLKSIQNSSPILTCIILGGNYLLLLAGVLFLSNDRILGHSNGAFASNVSGEAPTTEVCETRECKLLCMLPVGLLLVASSLVFGGMIGKATLIYVCAVKLDFSLSDRMKLVLRFVWPALFASVDVVLVLVWSLASSLVMKTEVLPTGRDDPPFIRVIQCRLPLQHQVVSNVIIGLLILYKSVVVLIGLVMAYNLRNVKKNSLRYWGTITWTMYNTSIFSVVLILSFFLITDFVIKQAIVAVLILLTVFITVSITGLPPVYYRFKDPSLERERSKSVDNTDKIVKNETMWVNEVTALQNDRHHLKTEIADLKCENMEMVRRMTLSEIDVGTAFDGIQEEPEPIPTGSIN